MTLDGRGQPGRLARQTPLAGWSCNERFETTDRPGDHSRRGSLITSVHPVHHGPLTAHFLMVLGGNVAKIHSASRATSGRTPIELSASGAGSMGQLDDEVDKSRDPQGGTMQLAGVEPAFGSERDIAEGKGNEFIERPNQGTSDKKPDDYPEHSGMRCRLVYRFFSKLRADCDGR